MNVASLLSGATRVGDALDVTITPDWLQGRTTYGGLSAGIALYAAKAMADDLPPLRSVQIAFVGPLSGAVRAVPSLLRRGKSSAFIACDLIAADGVGVRALFLFMAPRASHIEHNALGISLTDRTSGRRIERVSSVPHFLANFELIEAGEHIPGRWLRWAKLNDREGVAPELELMLIADALPPAAMSLATHLGPISTATWQVNLVTDHPRSNDGWWLIESVTLAAHDGASSQTMTIWNSAGTPVATATQSVALFI